MAAEGLPDCVKTRHFDSILSSIETAGVSEQRFVGR